MYYQTLDSEILVLGSRDCQDYATDTEVILIPQEGTRVFVHWVTDNEKFLATHTMISPIRATGKFRLTNGTNLPVTVKVVKL